ncbi:ABC transporter permease [Streptomyces sp. NPDC059850]|uniref:ABC transporter permease n=1 Tax=Streptomyces sp. NPDC059850 TaxID=3346970 RepID=UPI003669AA10
MRAHAFAALFLAITGLAAAIDHPDIQTLLWPTGSAFVVGLLYIAEGGARRNPLHYGLGTWLALTSTAALLLGIHTHNGLRTIDSRYVELAETLGLSRPRFLLHIVLPGALPGFLLGMRFAVTTAWLALAVVEQVNATSGIGYMMGLARTYGQTDIIIVGLVVYGLLGLLSDALVRLVEREALSWRRTLAD